MRGTEEKDQGTFASKSGNSAQVRNFIQSKSGITLIALVITIIIMIVLASVSINAIVGDNGIITQAQNATVQNSIANLEEYLQELYVENYDTIANSSYESKVEALAGITAYKYYFYNPSRDSSVGALSYISTSDGYVLYLINKSKLPEEIQELLIGGDAGDGEYADYATLNDVYGVTKDLKVYYCSGGVDTITGIASTELDTDNLSRVVFSSLSDSNVYNLSWYNLLSSYDANSDGELTVQELRSVKTLTISSSAGISSLSELYNLTSLGELTLDGLAIDNIDGIENALSLYYVYFKSSVIGDYTALCDVSNLTYLYFYDIDDDELETACTDISSAEFSKLKYMAVVGYDGYINLTSHLQGNGTSALSSSKSDKTITSLAPLDMLSSITKQSVEYLSVNNNNIEGNLSYISDYINLILLRCQYNSISSLYGLDNMDNLTYLLANDNELGDGTTDGTDTSISSLEDKENLYHVYMINNANLAYVDAFENDTAIRYLYLAGCSSDMIITTIANAGIIDNCIDYSLPVVYLNGTVFELANYFTASEFSDSQLIQYLKDNETIICLNLEYATSLTNNTLNAVLETMTQLQYVTLVGCTGLTTIDFVHGLTTDAEGNQTGVTELIELDLRDTNVTDLTNLNDYATSLSTLRISNTSIDLTTIQPTISRLTNSSVYWYASGRSGLYCTNSSLYLQLENCFDITSLCFGGWLGTVSYEGEIDLSNLTHLTFFRSGHLQKSLFILPASDYSYIGAYKCGISFVEAGGSADEYIIDNFVSIKEDYWVYVLLSLFDLEKIGTLTFARDYNHYGLSALKTGTGTINVESLIVGVYSKTDSSYTSYCFTDLSGVGVFSENLSLLSIANNYITDFSELSKLTALESLSITHTSLSDISFIESLTNILKLTLNDNNIAKLHPLQNLTNLTTLNLQNNAIYDTTEDDEGNSYNNLQILIDLYNNGSLRTLYISGNKITEDSTTNSYYKTLLSLDWTAKDF